jgi:hypothetical protein
VMLFIVTLVWFGLARFWLKPESAGCPANNIVTH